MKRFNSGVITLLIIAAYFIATAFIPDLYLAFNYKYFGLVFCAFELAI